MGKKLDPDIKVLRAANRALMESSSRKMLRANLEFLWDKFLAHPSREVLDRFDVSE